MKNTLIAITVLVTSLSSFAGVKETIATIKSQNETCLNSSDNQNTVGMKSCEYERFSSLDQLLNQEYQKHVKRLKTITGDQYADEANKETLRRLIKSERIWVQHRDADSDLLGTDSLGGTLEGLEIISSRADMTEARILELDQLFNFDK